MFLKAVATGRDRLKSNNICFKNDEFYFLLLNHYHQTITVYVFKMFFYE